MTELERVDELFLREYPRLVRSLSVAFDPESAADAVQDAFIRADARWNTVSKLEDPTGWIRRVAINLLTNGRRNQRRRRAILESVPPAPPGDDNVDDRLDLHRAVQALPERMRLCVCLHYLEGLAVDDVARALGVSPGTVKSNLHDGRSRLRAALEGVTHG